MSHLMDLYSINLTIIRVSFGIIFAIFGYNKLISGSNNLTELGSAMGLFGITWGYLLWGYAAAFTELIAGICFILGLYTRLAALPLIWLLIVAIRFHVEKNNPFTKWSFPLLCLCIATAFFISGSGIYSLDHMIKKCLLCKTTTTQNNDQVL